MRKLSILTILCALLVGCNEKFIPDSNTVMTVESKEKHKEVSRQGKYFYKISCSEWNDFVMFSDSSWEIGDTLKISK